MCLHGWRYRYWWSGHHDRIGVLLKPDLCDEVVAVTRKYFRVISYTMVIEELVRVGCTYIPQAGM